MRVYVLLMGGLLALILMTKIYDVLVFTGGSSCDWYTEAFFMVRWNQEGEQVFCRPVTRSMPCWIVRGRSLILFSASAILSSSFEERNSGKKLRQLNFDELLSRSDQIVPYGEIVSFRLFPHISQSTIRIKFRLGIDARSLYGTLSGSFNFGSFWANMIPTFKRSKMILFHSWRTVHPTDFYIFNDLLASLSTGI
jgi:hypothetical protein